jgi:hypothetical protein
MDKLVLELAISTVPENNVEKKCRPLVYEGCHYALAKAVSGVKTKNTNFGVNAPCPVPMS